MNRQAGGRHRARALQDLWTRACGHVPGSRAPALASCTSCRENHGDVSGGCARSSTTREETGSGGQGLMGAEPTLARLSASSRQDDRGCLVLADFAAALQTDPVSFQMHHQLSSDLQQRLSTRVPSVWRRSGFGFYFRVSKHDQSSKNLFFAGFETI